MTDEPALDFGHANEITMETYRQIAASYAQRHQRSNLPPFWQENIERFVEYLHTSPAWQDNPTLPILDAGCGPGRDSLIFAQQGFHVQAIDLSEEMLAQAHQQCLNQPEAARISFQQMDMRRLKLPAASCAGVWVSASFLHIPKQENLAVVRELARVLVPGGPLTLLVKAADNKPDERFDPAAENGSPRFFARYHGGEVWDLLEHAGLRVLFLASRTSEYGDSWLGALTQKPV